jgi:dihydrofolate reductase
MFDEPREVEARAASETRRRTMGKVLTHMTMSLDGYIADLHGRPGELFDWYQAGDVSVPSGNESVTFDVDAASAEVLGDLTEKAGALVAGRRLFDIAGGWNDSHPAGMPVVVVTHTPPEDAAERWPKTTFVNGVAPAIEKAKAIAGDKDVTLASPNVIAQALELGLVDEICVSLVPVLFGEGIPYFSKLDRGHLLLEDPVAVVQGRRALHLTYPVRR